MHAGDGPGHHGQQRPVRRITAVFHQGSIEQRRFLGNARHEFDQCRALHPRDLDQHLAVAADSACIGFDHAEREGNGNGGVHSVPAFPEDLQSGIGGHRVSARDRGPTRGVAPEWRPFPTDLVEHALELLVTGGSQGARPEPVLQGIPAGAPFVIARRGEIDAIHARPVAIERFGVTRYPVHGDTDGDADRFLIRRHGGVHHHDLLRGLAERLGRDSVNGTIGIAVVARLVGAAFGYQNGAAIGCPGRNAPPKGDRVHVRSTGRRHVNSGARRRRVEREASTVGRPGGALRRPVGDHNAVRVRGCGSPSSAPRATAARRRFLGRQRPDAKATGAVGDLDVRQAATVGRGGGPPFLQLGSRQALFGAGRRTVPEAGGRASTAHEHHRPVAPDRRFRVRQRVIGQALDPTGADADAKKVRPTAAVRDEHDPLSIGCPCRLAIPARPTRQARPTPAGGIAYPQVPLERDGQASIRCVGRVANGGNRGGLTDGGYK